MASTDNVSVSRVSPEESSGSSGLDKKPKNPKGSDVDTDGAKKKKSKSEELESENEPNENESDKGESDTNTADELQDGNKDGKSKDGKSKDGKEKDKLKESVAKVASATKAVGTAARAAYLMKLWMWLKSLLSMMGQLIQSVIVAIVNAIMTVVQTVAAIATTVATAIGVGVGVVAAGAAVIAFGGVIVVVAIVTNAVVSENAVRSDTISYNCEEDVSLAVDGANIADVSGLTLRNAQLAYSVFHELGLPDYNIAGILGNWSHESGIDSTGVEGIHGEPYSVTSPKKASALADLHSYTVNELFANYAKKDKSINRDAYMAGGKYYPGLGLAQWTGPRAKMLMDFAAAADMEWSDLGLQLAFAIAPTSSGGDTCSDFFTSWGEEASPESATRKFMADWEVISDSSGELREQAAAMWATEFVAWEIDVEYADSIIGTANAVQVDATNQAVADAIDKCLDNEISTAENGSLAQAAVSYAYATQAEGDGNNGTELYQTLHDAIFPDDPHYQSCDRGVATAVLWSGTDDSFPKGPCGSILSYLLTSSKWKKITNSGTIEGLEPGDILIRADDSVSHVIMYVGNEAVKEKFPEASDTACIVSASLDTRSPGVSHWYTGTTGYDTYHVFRNIQKESNPKYTDAAKSSTATAD